MGMMRAKAATGYGTGALAALCLSAALWLVPAAAWAMDWQRLWLNDDQRAAKQMEKHDYASAARTFDDKRWQAAAWYRAGDYKRSAKAWSKMDDIDAHYNRGNALARAGDLKDAAAEYQTVLNRDPDNVDARHNLEVIRKLMKPSKKSSSQNQNDTDRSNDDRQDQGANSRDASNQDQRNRNSGDQASGSPQRNAGRGEDQDENQDENQGREPNGGRNEQSTASSRDDEQRDQAQREQARPSSGNREDDRRGDRDQAAGEQDAAKRTPEQQAAMEQWLRRIPDDPGGLLRRKFRYQYSQRRRSGDQADEPW